MSIKPSPEKLWSRFSKKQDLNQEQIEQFEKYYNLLINYNKTHNLTAITELESILSLHFADSLALGNAINMHSIKSIADIGAGAGFPGLPLKIKYPHLSLILIEVTQKKQEFLRQVIELLNLDNCTVSGLDWRTFLRQASYLPNSGTNSAPTSIVNPMPNTATNSAANPVTDSMFNSLPNPETNLATNSGLNSVPNTSSNLATNLGSNSVLNSTVDLFCARASLQPEELIRALKPTSPYRDSKIVYWASENWQPSDSVKPYLKEEIGYSVQDRARKLIFFSN